MGKVKWIKLHTAMFDNAKIKYVRTLPEGNNMVLIWVMLLAKAGKCNSNGFIFLTENIPYTSKMLAAEFDFDTNVIELALMTFSKLGMIHLEDQTIVIAGWNEHQNVEGLEKIREQTRKRVAKYRENEKLLGSNVTSNVTLTQCNETEEEEEEEEDIDIYTISKDIVCSNKLLPIQEEWNKLNLSKIISIKPSSNRYKLLLARIKEYGIEKVIEAIKNINNSDFLKGQNNKGWIITFDWLIKPNNFLKVLEGNYSNKEGGTIGNNRLRSTRQDISKSESKWQLEIRRDNCYISTEDEERAARELL